MVDVPEPLRKVKVHYIEITPFGDNEPARVFNGVAYEDGIIEGEDVAQTHFEDCTFAKINFNNISVCLFKCCRFTDCEWQGALADAQFDNCELIDQTFSSVKFKNVRLSNCKMIKPAFDGETHFAQVELRTVRGLETSWRLEEVHVIEGFGHAWQSDLDHQIEVLSLPRMTKLTSWTRLRKYGELPFFGTSYTGLVSIPAALFLISIFNEQVTRLKAAGGTDGAEIGLLVGRLRPISVPSLSLLALASLFLLAVASTIYALACPARIKEFPYERWVDEFRRPAMQYLPLGWRRPFWRVVCWICYPLGAAGVAVVLACKLVTAALYILRHSPMPWGLK